MKSDREEEKFDLLTVCQFCLMVSILLVSTYNLVTLNFTLAPLMYILCSVLAVTLAIQEYKKSKSIFWCVFYCCLSLYLFSAIFRYD
ncbi:hypothetical protein SAMN05877842_11776 [Ureibacillus acetophenoni]|uniref:DUF3953 domain-containing protein n=1 Tax=Ureibacillus acetophenoni TaxID=614649 RepID=A0A285UPR1_9BACL|nr:hypothetical protein SAMN05877842_11776 [Ureibacillus acetophenoni]